MKEESNKYSGLEHVPPCSTWPPPWLAALSSNKSCTAVSSHAQAQLTEHVASTERQIVNTKKSEDPTLHVSPPPSAATAARHRHLSAIVDDIRRREFNGVFPDSLARVTAIYLELAQAPDPDAQALEMCIHAAVENWREMERLGSDSPPGLVKNLEVIDRTTSKEALRNA
jgi:hypothetical protein